ncbi:MAG: hypothetical protein AABX88_01025, partial [Nanoarchaeota archaeon]
TSLKFAKLRNQAIFANFSKDNQLSNSVAKTKVSHGRIETAVRVRNAKNKKELDLELKRLKILNLIDHSSIGEDIKLPNEIRAFQQLILIIGKLNLKTTREILLACKKLGYKGELERSRIKCLMYSYKDFFIFDKQKGWKLTNKGQTEFSRLNQFL